MYYASTGHTSQMIWMGKHTFWQILQDITSIDYIDNIA